MGAAAAGTSTTPSPTWRSQAEGMHWSRPTRDGSHLDEETVVTARSFPPAKQGRQDVERFPSVVLLTTRVDYSTVEQPQNWLVVAPPLRVGRSDDLLHQDLVFVTLMLLMLGVMVVVMRICWGRRWLSLEPRLAAR